jgi:hypothetical protein
LRGIGVKLAEQKICRQVENAPAILNNGEKMRKLLLALLVSAPVWALSPFLINGKPVDPGTFKNVVNIRIALGNGYAGCTATVVGPRTIITAAHCGATGGTATFVLDGVNYMAKLTQAPLYNSKDQDVSLGLVDKDVTVTPVQVSKTAVTTGLAITLLGFGCTEPGGTGGNDGVLRVGDSAVSGVSAGFDMILKKPAGAALCYGDSGGPAMWVNSQGKYEILGVNSKGNIQDTSYDSRLDLAETQAFLKNWATSNSTDICGVTKDCQGGPAPGLLVTTTNPKVGSMSLQLGQGVLLDAGFVKTNMDNLLRYLERQLPTTQDQIHPIGISH